MFSVAVAYVVPCITHRMSSQTTTKPEAPQPRGIISILRESAASLSVEMYGLISDYFSASWLVFSDDNGTKVLATTNADVVRLHPSWSCRIRETEHTSPVEGVWTREPLRGAALRLRDDCDTGFLRNMPLTKDERARLCVTNGGHADTRVTVTQDIKDLEEASRATFRRDVSADPRDLPSFAVHLEDSDLRRLLFTSRSVIDALRTSPVQCTMHRMSPSVAPDGTITALRMTVRDRFRTSVLTILQPSFEVKEVAFRHRFQADHDPAQPESSCVCGDDWVCWVERHETVFVGHIGGMSVRGGHLGEKRVALPRYDMTPATNTASEQQQVLPPTGSVVVSDGPRAFYVQLSSRRDVVYRVELSADSMAWKCVQTLVVTGGDGQTARGCVLRSVVSLV